VLLLMSKMPNKGMQRAFDIEVKKSVCVSVE